MSIRKPIGSSIEVQNAFEDVAQELGTLDDLRQQIADLQRELTRVKEQLVAVATIPTFDKIDGDLVVSGDLRVDGALNARGTITMPGLLGASTGDIPASLTSSAQRVVEINGSLVVLNALSADSIIVRELTVLGTITTP